MKSCEHATFLFNFSLGVGKGSLLCERSFLVVKYLYKESFHDQDSPCGQPSLWKWLSEKFNKTRWPRLVLASLLLKDTVGTNFTYPSSICYLRHNVCLSRTIVYIFTVSWFSLFHGNAGLLMGVCNIHMCVQMWHKCACVLLSEQLLLK
jgi:hypothetical protein